MLYRVLLSEKNKDYLTCMSKAHYAYKILNNILVNKISSKEYVLLSCYYQFAVVVVFFNRKSYFVAIYN